MYFYVLPGPFRTGFGITGRWEQRQRDYTGAWGSPARFSAVWEGSKSMVQSLEDMIKIQHRNLLWKATDDWTTEWFDNGWDHQQAETFVQGLITRTHLRLARIV